MTHLASYISTGRKAAFTVIALGLISLGTGRASAIELYATSIASNQIDRVDTVANTVTTYLNTLSAADSIMFDSAQRVIYTQLFTGDVLRYDPTSSNNVTIAGGFNEPADIVLEPGGNTMLVSEFLGGKIDRISLTNGAVSTLLTPGGNPEGLAYDGSRLFANLGLRSTGAQKFVAEIDPVTGAILAQSPLLSSLDGLAYDPYSGRLVASSLFGDCVYSINPTNLSDVVNITAKLGIIPRPDGITTDGTGDLYVASSGSLGDSHIYQIDLVTQTLTQETFVYGLDDLAPASGLGAIPEPSPLALVALGLPALLAANRRMKK